MKINWEVIEYKHKKKSVDWFWSLWIISSAIFFVSIKLHNPLFAILVFMGAFTMSLQAVRKPDLLKIKINEKGVVINKKIYPYETIDSYFILQTKSKLLIQLKNKIVPLISIPIKEEVDKKELDYFLASKLSKKDLEEPFTHKLVKYF